ncbi:MAG: hypothetical protein QGG50_05830, partial [Methanopyri archaeon]|nr:hypothetical protein [Methanopyri archaeon]
RMPRYATGDRCCVNALGEPYEGKPHVRFFEGLGETRFGRAPPVYSTGRVNGVMAYPMEDGA